MVKRIAGLVLMAVCLLALFCSAAAAQTLEDYHKVDKDRLFFEVPEGIVMVEGYPKYEPGKIIAKIDVEKTDWKTVIMYGGFPKLHFAAGCTRPSADYETNVSFNGGILSVDQDENLGVQYMIDYMENDLAINPGMWDNNHITADNGIEAGQITPDAGVLEPREARNDGQFICWLDKDNPDQRYYEWYTFDLYFTIDEPFNIPFKWLSAEMMAPTWTASQKNAEVQEIRNGSILYLLHNANTDRELRLVIDAPEGAAKAEIVYDGYHREEIPNSGGRFLMGKSIHPSTYVHAEALMVVFKDSSDTPVDYGALLYSAGPAKEDIKIWPEYAQKSHGWIAPESDRVILTNNSEDLGITFTYDQKTGLAYVDYDQDAEMTGSLGSIRLDLKAPKGATAYRMNGGGGNNIYGEDETTVAGQEFIVKRADIQKAEWSEEGQYHYITLIDRHPLKTVKVGPVTIYSQMGEIWPFGGGVQVVFWYADEEAAQNPENYICKEYIADANGVLTVVKRTPMVEEVTKPVTEVTVVGPYADDGWNLVIERYPQKGGDTFLYELHLENEYGAHVNPGDLLTIYMPYPKNHNDNHDYIYQMIHYEDDFSSYELVNVDETEYGLKFVIRSFSPFVLDWSGWEDDGSTPGVVVPNPEGPGDGGEGEGGEGGGDHGGNEPEQMRTFHRIFLDPNHRAKISGGHFGHISASVAGRSVITDSLIDSMVVMPHPREEWSQDIRHGIYLKGKTQVDNLVFIELEQLAETLDNGQTLVYADGGVTIGLLEIVGDEKRYDPAWIDGATPEFVIYEGLNEPITYSEFLASLGY